MRISYLIIYTASSLLFALSLAGCTREKTVEKQVAVASQPLVENTWGMAFESTPIGMASPEHRRLSKAVALVRSAEGDTATGFFISSDGLFLTNEHVIPRARCTRTHCAGIQIIRDFEPGGEFEVFNRFNVIAQNKDLDFALIRVELPAGKAVRFLELDLPDKLDRDADPLDDRPLWIIGHPFGAPLKLSNARLTERDSFRLHLNSVAISGNSGSPVIDAATSKVVALYHASEWSKQSINNKTGAVAHMGEAIDIFAIAKLLRESFPRFSSSPLDANAFATPAKTRRLSRVLPPRKAEIDETASLLSAAIGSDAIIDSSTFAALLDSAETEANSFDVIESWAFSLVITNLNRGSRGLLTSTDIERVRVALNESTRPGSTLTTLLRVQNGLLTQEDCVKAVDSGVDSTQNLKRVSQFCLSTKLKDGTNILDRLSEILVDGNWSNQQGSLKNAVQIIGQQLLLKMPTDAETKQCRRITALVAEQAEKWVLASRAEQLFTMLESPELFTGGSMKQTFSTK